jgi:ElaB/YqjD/DUF883 family membrane-anchored ribosome-binding protein
MSEMTVAQRDKLLTDMRIMVTDAEELLKLGAGDVSETARSLRDRLQKSLSQARGNLTNLQAAATEKVKAAGHAADEYVHENPWRAVAAGAGIGLVVGLLISRR